MFNKGDRIVLLIDNPDSNPDLFAGEEGTIALPPYSLDHDILVRFDKYSELAEGNNDLIRDIYDPLNRLSEEEYDSLVEQHTGRLWWVNPRDCQLKQSANFRKKRRNETQLEYKIAQKIHTLDSNWKAKQNAKTCSLSL